MVCDVHVLPVLNVVPIEPCDVHVLPVLNVVPIEPYEVHVLPVLNVVPIEPCDVHVLPVCTSHGSIGTTLSTGRYIAIIVYSEWLLFSANSAIS
jgi:hypothetical protein